MPQQPTRPTATSNLTEASRAATAQVNVQLPATIVSFDSGTQLATIRLIPKFRRRDATNGGQVVAYDPPDLPGVPVEFPGAGDWSITWPLAEGDVGLVTICDRSIDEWKATATSRTEPQDERRHDLTDGVFRPGVRSPADPLPAEAFAAAAMVLRGADIRLGSASATDPVALSSLVDDRLQVLADAIVTTWIPIPMDGGAALKTVISGLVTGGWPASVAATKAKAE